MKALNVILLVLLIAAVVAGVLIAVAASGDLRTARSSLEESRQQLEKSRKDLTEMNMKNRGLSESMSTIPDSLRSTMTGQFLEKSRSYGKIIRGLEREVSTAERHVRKRQRVVDDMVAKLRRRLILTGVAVVLLTGALVAQRVIRS
jgi:hypothetical protein